MTERSTRTVLAVGAVEAPIALYRTAADKHADIKFDSAGPNGGKLWTVAAAVPSPPPAVATLSETPDTPLGGDDVVEPLPQGYAVSPLPAEGEYRNILTEEGTGVAVERADIRRGIRTPKGFVDLTEHLAAVTEATRLDGMRVEGFLSATALEPERVIGSYWIAPEGSGYTLSLLRRAMQTQQAMAVVRWTKRTRQGLGVIVVHPVGLLLCEMAWSSLMREPRPEVTGFAAIEVQDEHLSMAEQLVAEMGQGNWLLDRLDDDAVGLKAELRQQALLGIVPPVPKLPEAPEDSSARLAESLA